jgi:hypothetical protein
MWKNIKDELPKRWRKDGCYYSDRVLVKNSKGYISGCAYLTTDDDNNFCWYFDNAEDLSGFKEGDQWLEFKYLSI